MTSKLPSPVDPVDADLIAPADAYTVPAEIDPRSPSPAPGGADEIPLPADPEQAGPQPDTEPETEPEPADDTHGVDRGRLLEVVATAEQFYRSQTAQSWVPAYLTDRGLGALTGRTDFAPASWSTAVDHLREEGFTDRELLAAGLARTSSRGTLINAFCNSAVLPVHNQDGQVVAFTGRRNPGGSPLHSAWTADPSLRQ